MITSFKIYEKLNLKKYCITKWLDKDYSLFQIVEINEEETLIRKLTGEEYNVENKGLEKYLVFQSDDFQEALKKFNELKLEKKFNV